MYRSFRLSLTRLSVEVLIIANTASKMKVTMLPLLAVTGLSFKLRLAPQSGTSGDDSRLVTSF